MKGYIFVFLTLLSIANAADICSKYPNGEFYPHPTDCEKFYVCNAGVSVERECAFNLHFNAIKKYCQSKESAKCDLSIPTTPKPTTPQPTTPKPTTPQPTTPKPTIPQPTTPPHPTLPPNPLSCKNQRLGKNIPYAGDCTKYITCIGGPVTRECPPTTVFNAALEVCDWPERANCIW